jgi:hypothetical protein
LFDEFSGKGGFADTGQSKDSDDADFFLEYPLFEGG